MSKLPSLMLAGLLVGAPALAADPPPATSAPGVDLETQLAAARASLEAAAREVAQLSAQLGQSAMAQVQGLRTRAVLGLQLRVEPSATEQGATIIGVSPGGPAAEAGLVAGDVIVALNGEPTTGANAPRQVMERMAIIKPDSKVTLKVVRDGKSREFQVRPRASVAELFLGPPGPGFGPGPGPGEGRPGAFDEPWRQAGIRHDEPGGLGALFDGLELADLSSGLGQYFGSTHGVLVIRVPREGDFLKLQDGDVILDIDGRVPENGSHATRILRSYQPGETIHLKVLRQKKTLALDAALPEHRHFGAGHGPGPGPGGKPGEPPPGAGGSPSTGLTAPPDPPPA